jgi:sec-independent protein translocase protein TatC
MDNIKPIDRTELASIMDKYSPYLKEARKRIVITLLVFAVSTLFGFFFYEKIIKILIDLLSLEGINIVFTSPFQFINLAISCGITTGLVVALPLLIFQILYFLKPALKIKEFRMIIRFLPLTVVLFILGFVFGAIIMKWQIEIFLARSVALGIGNILDISGLLSVVFLTSALMGIGFQFPIILLLLMRIGLLKQKQLSSKRPWVYLGSFIFVLFLPPDSILADILLSLPFILLFELTLLTNYILDRKKSS